jgi:hypothetical protein
MFTEERFATGLRHTYPSRLVSVVHSYEFDASER